MQIRSKYGAAITHLPLNKTAAISQKTLSSMKTLYLIQISLKFVLKVPIDNMPMLVEVMAWHRIGTKPLSESMLIHFVSIMTETVTEESQGSLKICVFHISEYLICPMPKV